jgi:hypothetical protein
VGHERGRPELRPGDLRLLKTRPRTRIAAYYARPSPYAIADKPRARAAYRRCITPIGAS